MYDYNFLFLVRKLYIRLTVSDHICSSNVTKSVTKFQMQHQKRWKRQLSLPLHQISRASTTPDRWAETPHSLLWQQTYLNPPP